jgi:hypothetical protein
MALEICTASGVCTGGGYLAFTAGGFLLGTSKDLVLKTYYYARERFEEMMKDKCEKESGEYACHALREAYYRRMGNKIQLTRGNVVKAIATGALLALSAYLATKYIF